MIGLTTLSDSTWADIVQAAEFLSPLVVALIAVWWGFRYQRRLADREALREAYIRVFLGLARMQDAIELLEGIKFADWQLMYNPLPEGKPRPEAIADSAERFWKLSNRLGFITEGDGTPREMPDGRFALEGASAMRMAQTATGLYNDDQKQVREANLRVLLGAPDSLKSTYLLRANVTIGRISDELARAFEGLGGKEPAPVDWAGFAQLTVFAQTQVHHALGGGKSDVMGLLQYREELPWPPEIREKSKRILHPRSSMTAHEGPSFIAWATRKRPGRSKTPPGTTGRA